MIFILFLVGCYSRIISLSTSWKGTINGILNEQRNVAKFLGINYATAKRWQAPIPIIANGTLDALEFGYSCPQICRDAGSFCPTSIGEDCLFLNVWVPMELNRTTNIVDFTSISTKLPTIVFIHGGSFQTGSGSLNALDGEILAKSLNAIVITINYRLSLFGFPGSDTGDSTSFNVGILDQRMALQWIYKNVETFGGINNQISLMGQSAGATSVIIHAFQPPLNSWIRNIILMSPPAMPFRSIAQGKQDFIDLANILKCIIPASNEITTDVINCLKTKSMRQLLDADELLRKNRNHGMASLDNWLIPIVDGVQIIDHPMLLMQKQNQKLNILYGTVSNETTWIIESAIPLSLPVQSSTLIINALFGESNSPQIKDVYDFKSLTTDTNYRDTISDMLSDMLFVCPNHRFLNYEFSNVFNYYWERPWSGGANEPLGKICKDTACHTTDLVYLFNDPESDASFNRSVAFRKFIKQFIRTGDPSIPDYKWDRSTLNSSVITRFTNDKLIGSFEKSVIHPRKQQCDYWNSQPYSFEKQYLQPTPIVYNGINSIWIVIAITIIIIIFAFQSIFLISMKFHRNQLIFNIGRIQSSNSSIDHDANQLEAMSILLDFVPNKMALTVKGLNYQVALDNNEMKPILKNCSFQCLPYTMTALLGPSGAGKTSLLSLVAKRFIHPESQECIFYGDLCLKDIDDVMLKNMIAFVAQYDAPYFGLTPREVMMYNAMLEFSSDITQSLMAKRVAYILNLMGLSSVGDVVINQVSDNVGGISGGQRRRLSIALALLKSPSIIFLDEPTSGLDSNSSLEVMTVLSKLAKQGYTILLTIHQPRKEIFELFQNTVILASGEVLFHGQRNDCIDSMRTLQKKLNISTAESFSDSINTADFILDVAANLNKQELAIALSSRSTWTHLSINRHARTTWKSQPPVINKKKYAPGFFKQFSIINARYWRVRPFKRKFSMLVVSTATSLVLGVLQRRIGADVKALTLQIKGLAVACIGLSALKNISISFDYYEDRDFYNFDFLNGSVRPLAFFIHRFIYETTMATIESGLSATITYFLLDCNHDPQATRTTITLMILYYNCIVSLYTFIYATRLKRPEARNISFFAQTMLAITSGVWIQKGDTVVYDLISWVQYINPNYWALSAIIRADVTGVGECTLVIDEQCRARVGDVLVESIGLEAISPNRSVIVLLIIWGTLRLMQWILLLRDAYLDTVYSKVAQFKRSKGTIK